MSNESNPTNFRHIYFQVNFGDFGNFRKLEYLWATSKQINGQSNRGHLFVFSKEKWSYKNVFLYPMYDRDWNGNWILVFQRFFNIIFSHLVPYKIFYILKKVDTKKLLKMWFALFSLQAIEMTSSISKCKMFKK